MFSKCYTADIILVDNLNKTIHNKDNSIVTGSIVAKVPFWKSPIYAHSLMTKQLMYLGCLSHEIINFRRVE